MKADPEIKKQQMLTITECPRDAMQGIVQWIPTELKIKYLQQLLNVGFARLDFGSFVSPKAIPQMKDTAQVFAALDLKKTKTELLAIIANVRGAEDACAHGAIRYLGFPFSISETFQMRNANSGIEEALKRVGEIQSLCVKNEKELLVYISMAFGNPYGDPWNEKLALEWCHRLTDKGIRYLALADTTGSSDAEGISSLFSELLPSLHGVEVAAHLHSTKELAYAKVRAAWESGCRNFDVAIHGFGGCPMAKEELTGNIATETLIEFAQENSIPHGLNMPELQKSYAMSWEIFNVYH
jgi:hydroxymethylglutaryl-CoA lyase